MCESACYSSCNQAGSIPRSLCCSCSFYLQLPVLVTVAVLSMQPWSSCRRAAFIDPPPLRRGGGGGFCVPTIRKQHRCAEFNTLSSTLSVEGEGKLNYSIYTWFNIYTNSVFTHNPARLTLQKLPSAILENSKSRSSQKNSNSCHDYLCIVISVFISII